MLEILEQRATAQISVAMNLFNSTVSLNLFNRRAADDLMSMIFQANAALATALKQANIDFSEHVEVDPTSEELELSAVFIMTCELADSVVEQAKNNHEYGTYQFLHDTMAEYEDLRKLCKIMLFRERVVKEIAGAFDEAYPQGGGQFLQAMNNCQQMKSNIDVSYADSRIIAAQLNEATGRCTGLLTMFAESDKAINQVYELLARNESLTYAPAIDYTDNVEAVFFTLTYKEATLRVFDSFKAGLAQSVKGNRHVETMSAMVR